MFIQEVKRLSYRHTAATPEIIIDDSVSIGWTIRRQVATAVAPNPSFPTGLVFPVPVQPIARLNIYTRSLDEALRISGITNQDINYEDLSECPRVIARYSRWDGVIRRATFLAVAFATTPNGTKIEFPEDLYDKNNPELHKIPCTIMMRNLSSNFGQYIIFEND